MRIEVLLFAAIREAAGSDTLVIEVDDNACAQDVIESVGRALPAVASLMPACRIAIDSCYVAGDARIPRGCDIAMIPPVSGG